MAFELRRSVYTNFDKKLNTKQWLQNKWQM
jgi:hypothetical protein